MMIISHRTWNMIISHSKNVFFYVEIKTWNMIFYLEIETWNIFFSFFEWGGYWAIIFFSSPITLRGLARLSCLHFSKNGPEGNSGEGMVIKTKHILKSPTQSTLPINNHFKTNTGFNFWWLLSNSSSLSV